MRKYFVSVAAVIAMSGAGSFAAPDSTSPPPESSDSEQRQWGDTLWVANRDADTLTVVEAATGTIVRTLAIGRGPHDVVVSSLVGKAYVMNELEDRIAVVSASTLQVLRTLTVPRPHHAKISADGRTVYVGLFNTNQIATIDTVTDEVRIFTTSNNPNARAHAPRPSHNGRFILVPHEVGDEVTALDAATGRLVGGVHPGSMPSEVLAAADGLRLFVSMRGEGTVKVFSLATAQATGSVSVGTQPESLIMANDQRTLVVSLRGSPATLAFVDANTLRLLGTVPIAGSGTFGDLAILSPNGRYVYATFDAGISGTGGVAVVDVQNGQRLGGWSYPGVGRPHGLAYSTTSISVP